jgi:hypothetical protein
MIQIHRILSNFCPNIDFKLFFLDCSLQGERSEHALQGPWRKTDEPVFAARNEVWPWTSAPNAHGPSCAIRSRGASTVTTHEATPDASPAASAPGPTRSVKLGK